MIKNIDLQKKAFNLAIDKCKKERCSVCNSEHIIKDINMSNYSFNLYCPKCDITQKITLDQKEIKKAEDDLNKSINDFGRKISKMNLKLKF